MRRLASLFLMLILVLSFFGFFESKSFAASPAKKDLMITSLETSRDVYAGQTVSYSVQVDSMDQNNPKSTMRAYNVAHVTVYFKNSNNKLIKSRPSPLGKGGIYKGKVTLPGTGQWDVLVTALRKGEKEAANSSNVYTLTTQLPVHPPKGNSSIWLYGFAIGLGVVILLLIIRFIRRLNQRGH